LKVFDVIVDSDTSAENLARLHDTGFNVVVAHLLDRGSRRRIDDGENQQYTKLPELFGELALTHERGRVAIFGELIGVLSAAPWMEENRVVAR